MAGIWLLVVPVFMLLGAPLLLQCSVVADCGSDRRRHLWFGGLTAALGSAALIGTVLALRL